VPQAEPGATVRAESPIAGRGLFTTLAVARGTQIGNTETASLINHSCDPNLGWAPDGTLVAIGDIAEGAELTVDYALALDDPSYSMFCHCESYRCRQVIEGTDWQIPQLRARYRGYWAPAVQAHIDALPVRVEIVDGVRTRALRRAVLRPQLAEHEPLPGDDLVDAVHIAALDTDGIAVGTCFLYPDRCPWLPDRPGWHLRQMATAPERRGHGIGAAVVAFAIREVQARGADVLWCNAREYARGFYASSGFVEHGPVFTDERHPIPHVQMWRAITESDTDAT
jgi:GNAT superfamily N-acetyltransferase